MNAADAGSGQDVASADSPGDESRAVGGQLLRVEALGDAGTEHPSTDALSTEPGGEESYPPFGVTVDLAVFSIVSGVLAVLLVRRGTEPYAGCWALPGGFVRTTEDLDDAAYRELEEETGLSRAALAVNGGHLEQLRTYGAPGRDPRTRVVSTAYVVLAPDLPPPTPGSDAAQARWWNVDDLVLPGLVGTDVAEAADADALAGTPELAFDHAWILADAVERVAAKLEYSPLATAFVGREFTLGELQHVYDTVWGTRQDRANFRRKLLTTPGLVEPVPGAESRLTGGRGRPAVVYRAGDATALHPPLLRPEGARRRQG
jgi:8-oxo-dGTP diphosphatase